MVAASAVFAQCTADRQSDQPPRETTTRWSVASHRVRDGGVFNYAVSVTVPPAEAGRWYVFIAGARPSTNLWSLGSWGDPEHLLVRHVQHIETGDYYFVEMAQSYPPHQLAWLPARLGHLYWTPYVFDGGREFAFCQAEAVTLNGSLISPLGDVRYSPGPSGRALVPWNWSAGTAGGPRNADWHTELELRGVVTCETHTFPSD